MWKQNPTRILNLGEKQCRICGQTFTAHNSRQVYCSNDCYLTACKGYPKKQKPWKPPREIVCIKCGSVFRGKGRQQICMRCLETRPDCRRYRENRSERMMIHEK